MLTGNSNRHLPLQIKQDDKFFCWLLSKETSISIPSFRVSLAIPFEWESEPGTPKYCPFSEDTLPTLTPPPSYYFNSVKKKSPSTKMKAKKPSRFNPFHTLFSKLNLKRTLHLKISSSSSSSPVSFWVVPVGKHGRRRFLTHGSSSSSSSFDWRGHDDDDDEDCGSLTSNSTLMCFGIHRTNGSTRRAN